MTTLYHVTTEENLAKISSEGLRPNSYWASDTAVVAYYKDVVCDEGQVPVVLEMPLEALSNHDLHPDKPGLEEPISCAIGMDEDEVWKAWEGTDRSWQACLELIGSVRCASSIGLDDLATHNAVLSGGTASRRKPGM